MRGGGVQGLAWPRAAACVRRRQVAAGGGSHMPAGLLLFGPCVWHCSTSALALLPRSSSPHGADGKLASGLYVHPFLSTAVGTCIAAFARCMLAGQTQPGVWFPEERGALADRKTLLGMSTEGCTRFLLNRTPWQVRGGVHRKVQRRGGLDAVGVCKRGTNSAAVCGEIWPQPLASIL